MERYRIGLVLAGLALASWGSLCPADTLETLSIYDVQYTTDPGGESPETGNLIDLTGGIVTHIWFGGKARVYLQDPAYPEWGGIMIKDWTAGCDLANGVSIGDRVDLTDVYVEESGGNTVLQFRGPDSPDAAFSNLGFDQIIEPILLDVGDLPVPVDHAASERFESMVVTFESVTVGQLGLGKVQDNYQLIQGSDIAWGTDYQNIDAGGPYHPRIYSGAELESITGVVEQNLVVPPDDPWDYYQLVTRSTADIVPEPGTALLVVLAGAALASRRRARPHR